MVQVDPELAACILYPPECWMQDCVVCAFLGFTHALCGSSETVKYGSAANNPSPGEAKRQGIFGSSRPGWATGQPGLRCELWVKQSCGVRFRLKQWKELGQENSLGSGEPIGIGREWAVLVNHMDSSICCGLQKPGHLVWYKAGRV